MCITMLYHVADPPRGKHLALKSGENAPRLPFLGGGVIFSQDKCGQFLWNSNLFKLVVTKKKFIKKIYFSKIAHTFVLGKKYAVYWPDV